MGKDLRKLLSTASSPSYNANYALLTVLCKSLWVNKSNYGYWEMEPQRAKPSQCPVTVSECSLSSAKRSLALGKDQCTFAVVTEIKFLKKDIKLLASKEGKENGEGAAGEDLWGAGRARSWTWSSWWVPSDSTCSIILFKNFLSIKGELWYLLFKAFWS